MPQRKTQKTKKPAKKPKLFSSHQEICDVYKEDFNICLAEINYVLLPGKMLLEPMTTLSEKSASKWTDKDVISLAKLLAGRISIDTSRENHQGANASGKLAQILNEYIFTHPKIRSIMDPIYVVVDLNTGIPVNINFYPPPGSPHIAAVLRPGTHHVFIFNGPGATDDVQHLIG
ncbi:unnamed protein product [Rhizophagus irregularis]|nr:unnamed protein product [Rhizophagus irregularis]